MSEKKRWRDWTLGELHDDVTKSLRDSGREFHVARIEGEHTIVEFRTWVGDNLLAMNPGAERLDH